MRIIITTLLLCAVLGASAKAVKLNRKHEQRPITFKVEKMEVTGGNTLIHITARQRERFSYTVSFADCRVYTAADSEGVQGKLVEWNEEKRNLRDVQNISDKDDEEFILSFPTTTLQPASGFDLKIGNIQDRDKTEIIVKNLKTKK